MGNNYYQPRMIYSAKLSLSLSHIKKKVLEVHCKTFGRPILQQMLKGFLKTERKGQ